MLLGPGQGLLEIPGPGLGSRTYKSNKGIYIKHHNYTIPPTLPFKMGRYVCLGRPYAQWRPITCDRLYIGAYVTDAVHKVRHGIAHSVVIRTNSGASLTLLQSNS